jgi:hypothetical protein
MATTDALSQIYGGAGKWVREAAPTTAAMESAA